MAYYLVGTFNNWTQEAAYELVAKSAGVYALTNIALTSGAKLKVQSSTGAYYANIET